MRGKLASRCGTAGRYGRIIACKAALAADPRMLPHAVARSVPWYQVEAEQAGPAGNGDSQKVRPLQFQGKADVRHRAMRTRLLYMRSSVGRGCGPAAPGYRLRKIGRDERS